jgi:hypothetical protein
VIVCTGLSQKNATRLHADGAFAFLEKSPLGLDIGPEALLAALGEIVKQIPKRRACQNPGCGRPKMSAAPGITCHDLRISKQTQQWGSYFRSARYTGILPPRRLLALALHENKSLTGGNSEQVYGVYVQ